MPLLVDRVLKVVEADLPVAGNGIGDLDVYKRQLLQQTDERHPMTVPEMISELAKHGVAAERKSIYNDLESLRIFGLDIVQTKSRTTGYYIGARSFEVPERCV